jgi:ribosome biogenesis SPOUT family RNA methylase Rps3
MPISTVYIEKISIFIMKRFITDIPVQSIMPKIIIEHLDPRLWKWSLMEYRHASDYIGKGNIIFTNIKSASSKAKLDGYGTIKREKIEKLGLRNACILDPYAKEVLTPKDKFDYYILGGILGNFPPEKRTRKELTSRLGFPARNLGRSQMSTNTAAIVTWKIAHGARLESLKFRNKLKIKTGEFEEVILPYKYLLEDGKLLLPEGYIEMAKKSW